MSKGLVAAAGVAGLLIPVLAASPALAAPEINQADCEAANGTFSREKGVKSCTTTTTETQTIPMQVQNGPIVATWLEERTYAVTTTQTQKGNGEVSSTSQTPVLLSRVAHDQTCALVVGEYTYPAPISQCAEVYPV